MRFKKDQKIDECAATEPGRYAMHAVQLEVETAASASEPGKGKLIATDGRCLAVLDVETDEGDVSGLIPLEAIKAARKHADRGKDSIAHIEANGCALVRTKEGDKIECRRPEGEFPRWPGVVPKADAEFASVIQVNAEYLLAVQQALGAESIRLHIQKDEQYELGNGKTETRPRAIRITAGEGKLGVVMPIKIDD